MTARRIRVSSNALGESRTVTVMIYDDLASLRAAAESYNGSEHPDSLGTTQASFYDDGGLCSVIVRLARGELGTQIVSHEMHHAATAIYGDHVRDGDPDLTHFNEPFAHLYSDLFGRLVRRLYLHHFYGGDR